MENLIPTLVIKSMSQFMSHDYANSTKVKSSEKHFKNSTIITPDNEFCMAHKFVKEIVNILGQAFLPIVEVKQNSNSVLL